MTVIGRNRDNESLSALSPSLSLSIVSFPVVFHQKQEPLAERGRGVLQVVELPTTSTAPLLLLGMYFSR